MVDGVVVDVALPSPDPLPALLAVPGVVCELGQPDALELVPLPLVEPVGVTVPLVVSVGAALESIVPLLPVVVSLVVVVVVTVTPETVPLPPVPTSAVVCC